MKITILGAGPGLPNPENNLSAIAVKTEYGVFMADCGEGTARQMLKHGLNKEALDAIIITHYHPDHVGGLFMVLQMLYLEGRKKPLRLFLPERPLAFLDMLHTFYTFEQRFGFALEVLEINKLNSLYPEIIPLPNDHLKGYRDVISRNGYSNEMLAFSLEFTEMNKRFIYTSDLGSFHGLEQHLIAADLVIMDALHPVADIIIEFAANYPNRLVLTHGISPKLKSWLESSKPANTELAQENLTYVL